MDDGKKKLRINFKIRSMMNKKKSQISIPWTHDKHSFFHLNSELFNYLEIRYTSHASVCECVFEP
jgi:hypothetical protein